MPQLLVPPNLISFACFAKDREKEENEKEKKKKKKDREENAKQKIEKKNANGKYGLTILRCMQEQGWRKGVNHFLNNF